MLSIYFPSHLGVFHPIDIDWRKGGDGEVDGLQTRVTIHRENFIKVASFSHVATPRPESTASASGPRTKAGPLDPSAQLLREYTAAQLELGTLSAEDTYHNQTQMW